ncbi:MAG: DUF1080 domain-containing protein [Bacteroidetes bacterium]|nr:DUF1080 domain-containing protein [Fibrella sp.]
MKNAPFVLALGIALVSVSLAVIAQTQRDKQTHESTEIWEPVPPVITPGTAAANATGTTPPSDAVVLFDGKNTDEWVAVSRGKTVEGPLQWPVTDGVLYSAKGFSARSKKEFTDFQLHVEFKTPSTVEGNGQSRGNSGIFLQGRYELQVLDNYNNPTYVNGMIGSIYKQAIPLVNPCRKPGEWQTYDIVYQAPAFNKAGLMTNYAYVTVLLNGVLVQNHAAIRGTTAYIGYPKVQAHGAGPIMIQDHGNPVGYRNIWIREL